MTAKEVLEKELEACLVVFRVQVLGSWMILSHSKVSECFKGLDGSRSKEKVCGNFGMVVFALSRWETWN